MSEQERREAVAAVPVHEHLVRYVKSKVDGAQDKVSKFEAHLSSLRDDLKRAKEELRDEEAALDEARRKAEAVLAEGPVSIRGQEVRALAGVAGAAIEGKGGNS
jgi:septal ring factor EnvC (AmiA/AmiB activator)